jgi:hypothetical protein
MEVQPALLSLPYIQMIVHVSSEMDHRDVVENPDYIQCSVSLYLKELLKVVRCNRCNIESS